MVRTRKLKKFRATAARLPRDAMTYDGVYNWYRAKFEKLGWMVLAKAKGDMYKVNAYKKGIQSLLRSITHLMKESADLDRQHDLLVLHMNTKCLHDYVMKHL